MNNRRGLRAPPYRESGSIENKGRVYYTTKLIRSNGRNLMVYLDNQWGLKAGVVLDLMIYDIDDPNHYAHIKKTIIRLGNSIGLYINKSYKFNKGDMVVIRAKCLDNPAGDTDVGNSGKSD